MELGSIFILGAIVAAAATLVRRRLRVSRDEVTRRAFAQPIVKIGEAREKTRVVLVGTVSHTEAVTSPVSHRACAAFEYVEAIKRSDVWHERTRRIAGVDFAIDDTSGEVLVRGANIEMLLMKDEKDTLDDLERREGLVQNGDQVAVFGYVTRVPDPRPEAAGLGYRQRPTVLAIRSTRRYRARITNSPAILQRAARP